MQKIKKGDMVQVVAGKDKGKRGQVLEVIKDQGKVRVDGVAIQKKHLKPNANPRMPNGGIIERPGKLPLAKVMFYSEKLGRAVRVGIKIKADGTRVRVARGRAGQGAELD